MNAHTHATPDGAQAKQPPVVICVAPNGARRTRKDHPALPMTAAELGALVRSQRTRLALRQIDVAGLGNTGNRFIVEVEGRDIDPTRLQACAQGKTLLLITHRASMLSLVDRLVVLDNGHIVADGPKEAVIEALRKGRVGPAAV